MKISQNEGIDNQKDLAGVKLQVQRFANEVEQTVNNGLSFADNFKAQILVVNFTSANTNTQINHQLGSVPTGYIPIGKSVSLDIYDGSTDVFNKTFVTLKSSAIGSATIMIF